MLYIPFLFNTRWSPGVDGIPAQTAPAVQCVIPKAKRTRSERRSLMKERVAGGHPPGLDVTARGQGAVTDAGDLDHGQGRVQPIGDR